MSNFHSIQLEQAATPEQRASWQRALEAEQRINGTAFTPASPTATIGGKVMEIHAGTTSGNDRIVNHGVQSADVTPAMKAGRVMIGGVETTIESAIAAGLMTREDAAAGFKQPVQPKAQAGAGTEQATKETPKATTEPATEAAQAAAEAGKVLDSLDQAIGSHAVDMALDSVVEDGYLPETDELPEGVDQGHVFAVMAGYVAQAQSTLSDVGSSVSMLMETLTDDELRDARRATVQNNPELMHNLGRQAVERLARMPESNPEAFAEMMEGMSPEERSVLNQTARGEWTVAIPGYPEMSFAAAVRTGIVRV